MDIHMKVRPYRQKFTSWCHATPPLRNGVLSLWLQAGWAEINLVFNNETNCFIVPCNKA